MNKNLFFYIIIFFVCLTSNENTFAQRYIEGDFSGGDWAGGTEMTASAGTSLIYTKQAGLCTCDKYFRLHRNDNTEIEPGAADVTISGNNSEITTMRDGTTYSWKIAVPNGGYNYIFKTVSATSENFIVFEVRDSDGGIRTLGAPTQSPVAASVTAGSTVAVNTTISGSWGLALGQKPYIRYSTVSNFATSTVAAMTVTTAATSTATVDIPAGVNTAGTTVYYYIFMSGDGTSDRSPAPPSDGSRADLFTHSLQNNGGSNYSYTVSSIPTYFSSDNFVSPNTFTQGSAASMTETPASSGSYLLTTTSNTVGTSKFRFYSSTSGGTVYEPNGGADVAVTLATNTALQVAGSGFLFTISTPNTSDNYCFKTAGSGTPGTSKMIVFRVEGTVRTVSSVAQNFASPNPLQSVIVTATLSGAFPTGQGAYLRYTTDAWATSSVVSMSGSGTSWTGTIPAQALATTVSYYVFTSGSGLTIAAADVDYYTINRNNNGNSNYSYTVLASPIYFSTGNFNPPNSWTQGSATAMTETPASSGCYLATAVSTVNNGNAYYRFYSALAGGTNYEANGGADVLVSLATSTALQVTGSGRSFYFNTPNLTDNYCFKTTGSGTPGTSKMIIFRVQGTVQTISSVSQDLPTPTSSQSVVVTATLSGAFATGQGAYLRYTTDAWATSSVVSMSGSGTSWTGTIPAQASDVSVSYKIFTSGNGLTISAADADFYTINVNTPTTYTVASPVTITSNGSGNWNTGATWVGGVVPSSADNVVIANTHSVTLDAAKTCNSLTINVGGTYTGSSNTLTIASGGTLTNNGTFTCNTGTISFAGAATISGTSIFNNVTIAGAVNFGTASTITGNLTINSGGSVLTNAPAYTCPATLIINTTGTRSRSTEWGAVTTGTGYPCNVQISNSTTYDVGAGGAATTAQIGGSLTIDNSCIFTLDGSTDRTAGVTITGNVTVGGGASGTMTLSTQSGGDLTIGGNLTRGVGSTWTNNGRAVTFNGSSDQTLSYTGGGTQQFDYLTINKSAGNLVLSSSPATSMQIQSTSGNVLTINNTGGIDVNGQTFTLGCTGGCAGGNILVDGGARTITSSVSGGIIRIQGASSGTLNKTVTSANSGTLTFSTNTILAIKNCDFNPGSSLTTINAEALIEAAGDFITNAPTYATGSTLKFKTGTDFKLTVAGTPQKAWVPGASGAGVPYNVTIEGISGSATTTVTAENGNGGQNGFYVRNNLTLQGYSGTQQGEIALSNTNGPNTLYVGGNYTQNEYTSINENSQKIIFYGGDSGNNNQVIDGSLDADAAGVTFYDMQVDNDGTATVTLQSTNLVISNVLTLTDGWLVLGSNTLTLNSGSSVSGVDANSWVVTNYAAGTGNTGCMMKKAIGASSNFTFPVGPSTSSYNPLRIETAGAGHTSDDFSARVLIGVAPTSAGYSNAIAVSNTTEFVNRTWEIFEGTPGGSNCDLTPQWAASHENSAFTRANSRVSHYTGGTWANVTVSTRLGSDPYTVRAGAFASFSPVIVGEDPPFSLPIELISFTGKAGKDGNHLEWTTASEINNDYFTLETSPDGINFNAIATIPGAGNSNQILNYSFFDNENLAIESGDVIYYRLKQTDFDGKYSYSKVIALNRLNGTKLTVKSLFVDADNNLSLTLSNPENMPAKLEITDAIGRLVYYQNIKNTNGLVKVNLPGNYASQVLILKVFNGQDFIIKKFVY